MLTTLALAYLILHALALLLLLGSCWHAALTDYRPVRPSLPMIGGINDPHPAGR